MACGAFEGERGGGMQRGWNLKPNKPVAESKGQRREQITAPHGTCHSYSYSSSRRRGSRGNGRVGEQGHVGENCETDFSQFHFVLAVETVINLMKECVVHTFYLTRDEDDFRHLRKKEGAGERGERRGRHAVQRYNLQIVRLRCLASFDCHLAGQKEWRKYHKLLKRAKYLYSL